ncbi:hypothetical protein [Haloferax sp. ATB1]|uniref:hypothetical protein n=1 Tax=Haloferax sp. ATB1 TaxID=1508454 RepID=UPI000FE1400A|nr:hypothetical protein [Haloferax sp. ATB1]
MNSNSPRADHFTSETQLKQFVHEISDDYQDIASQFDTYEAATAVFEDYDLCPWNITSFVRGGVPHDELSGPDPRDQLRHEAVLAVESLLEQELQG